MRFEITPNSDYDDYVGHRGVHPPNPELITADRYEIRTIGNEYSSRLIVSFYTGDVETNTLFTLPRSIRVITEA